MSRDSGNLSYLGVCIIHRVATPTEVSHLQQRELSSNLVLKDTAHPYLYTQLSSKPTTQFWYIEDLVTDSLIL